MDKNISNNIVESCKKCGINYKSCNPNYVNFTNDAQLLVQLYKDLQQIANKLDDISKRHNIPCLTEIIRYSIEEIEKIDHNLIRLASEIRKEEKW